ncbi:MAG: GNAT family N-acetyltransferase [Actinomycetes bacterium]
MRFTTSYDPSDLDIETVIEWLSKDAYWAIGRDSETIKATFNNSIPISVRGEDRKFIGVGRLVTDGYTFGWLCDVYVHPDHRGLGVGHAITKAAISYFQNSPSFRLILKTRDAHSIYKECGFLELSSPENWLGIEQGF